MAVYDVEIRVAEQQGVCPVGFKVGDTFLVKEGLSPSGMCMTAMSALLPAITVLMVGGSFPWESDSESTKRGCQDYKNPVVFEVRRLPKSQP